MINTRYKLSIRYHYSSGWYKRCISVFIFSRIWGILDKYIMKSLDHVRERSNDTLLTNISTFLISLNCFNTVSGYHCFLTLGWKLYNSYQLSERVHRHLVSTWTFFKPKPRKLFSSIDFLRRIIELCNNEDVYI